MATYFLFGKYSAEAVKGMNPNRTEQAAKLIQKFGGELKSMYALLGEHDLVVIATFPGTEQVVKASLAITRLTGITFATSEAIAVTDFDRMITAI
jgi:uncharacterized protein with GYD domain